MSRISSDYLFHYTSKLEWLKSILKEGLRVSYCLEDLHYFEDFFDGFHFNDVLLAEAGMPVPEREKITYRWAVPMACFCDIPVELASSHAEIYGGYAIAFTQEWGTDKGMNPLQYIVPKSNVAAYMKVLNT